MNRIKGFVYDLITFFASIGSRNRNAGEKVLLVRVDEIGDYLLWRKFIIEILTSSLCQQKEVHFIGNAAWKSLFDIEFSDTTFTKIFWLNKQLYKTSINYRFRFSKNIFQENYTIVINPTYSRAKRVDDSLVKAAKANSNYGYVRNNENYLPYEQSYDRNLYDKLLQIHQKPVFEFNRNKAFTEWLTQSNSLITNTSLSDAIKLPEINKKYNTPDNYFIVFPGSRSNKRIWSAENFTTDSQYGDAFENNYNHPMANLIGRTNLPETLALLKGAKCILSVDTGSIHLAASVNCLSFGIFNGSQYGRFSPYPNTVSTKIKSIYPASISNEIANMDMVNEKYEHIVPIDYNEVSALQVIEMIEKENLL
jgi:ADP-heptose:LPS heptosyltransferase